MKSSSYHYFFTFSNLIILLFLLSIYNKHDVFMVIVQAHSIKEPEFLRHNLNNKNTHRSLQEEEQQTQRTCFPECVGMQAEDCISIIEKDATDSYVNIQYPRSFEFGRVVVMV